MSKKQQKWKMRGLLRQILAAGILCLALTGCSGAPVGAVLGEPLGGETAEAAVPEETETAGNAPETAESAAQTEEVYVYVCGCVAAPGVYALPVSARVQDAVEAAGGFDEGADTEYWNLAEPVSDGEQIRIPTLSESESMEERAVSEAAAAEETASGLVNLNTATREELMTLTGIGEAKADAILAYREENGAFASIEEIMNVSGIKEAGFEKIKDQITV
ncbi:MAG: helix-hairpin-helix domain-containing protein [Lachnospiraceae bacterium]|nr:helix-hairpin-helix domain-containing protein [Lachnospiraceae bacterium]